MSRIVPADITDNLFNGLVSDLQPYCDRADTQLVALAKRLGVDETDIASPIGIEVKDWLIAWVGREICFDIMGTNDLELPDDDKYRMKLQEYKDRETDARSYLTPEIIMDVVNDRFDTSTSFGTMVRQ
ncbi:MAG: hypothetical protein U9Q21_02630 [Candidatus Auribacterota bacterium]|nr:hypothetical protein [Candidatus Auribacterota bacterium]